MKLPLATSSWDHLEFEAMQEVIDSKFFTMGVKVKNFEDKFSAYMGAKYCVMVNSGSSANLLAIAALFFVSKNKLKRGDEIIVPAVSWSTTYTPLQQYGLKLIFVDICKESLNIDVEKVKRVINDKTKAIFAVNLLGNPCELDKLKLICDTNNLILVEDNCESMGSKLNGKYSGSFGKLGTFSSFFSHHISTMEGGMVITDDKELYEIMLSLRAHGWTRNLPDNSNIYSKSEDKFYESFNFILPGYNLRPLELSGAIGSVQIDKLSSIVDGRRKNAKVFFDHLKESELPILTQKEIGYSSWFGFSLIFENLKWDMEEIKREFKKNEIDFRPIVAGNFTKNTVIKYFDYKIPFDLSNAELIHNRGLFIGNHHYDCSNELISVVKILKHIFDHN